MPIFNISGTFASSFEALNVLVSGFAKTDLSSFSAFGWKQSGPCLVIYLDLIHPIVSWLLFLQRLFPQTQTLDLHLWMLVSLLLVHWWTHYWRSWLERWLYPCRIPLCLSPPCRFCILVLQFHFWFWRIARISWGWSCHFLLYLIPYSVLLFLLDF